MINLEIKIVDCVGVGLVVSREGVNCWVTEAWGDLSGSRGKQVPRAGSRAGEAATQAQTGGTRESPTWLAMKRVLTPQVMGVEALPLTAGVAGYWWLTLLSPRIWAGGWGLLLCPATHLPCGQPPTWATWGPRLSPACRLSPSSAVKSKGPPWGGGQGTQSSSALTERTRRPDSTRGRPALL